MAEIEVKQFIEILWNDTKSREKKLPRRAIPFEHADIEEQLNLLAEQISSFSSYLQLYFIIYEYKINNMDIKPRIYSVKNSIKPFEQRRIPDPTVFNDPDNYLKDDLSDLQDKSLFMCTYYASPTAKDPLPEFFEYFCKNRDEFIKNMGEDANERKKFSIQNFKLLLILKEKNISSEEVGLIQNLFGSFIVRIAELSVKRQTGEVAMQKIRDKISQLGDIPHNIKSHIIDNFDPEKCDEFLKYLKKRAIYLEFMAKEDMLKMPEIVSELNKFLDENLEKNCDLAKLIDDFIELELFKGAITLSYEEEDSLDDEEKDKKRHEIWKNKLFSKKWQEEDEFKCSVFAGAVENVIENLCSNSLTHGAKNEDGNPIDNFTINLGLERVEKDKKAYIRIKYSDNGIGFTEEKIKKIRHWLKNGPDNQLTREGQGFRSMQMAAEALKGWIDFNPKKRKNKNKTVEFLVFISVQPYSLKK